MRALIRMCKAIAARGKFFPLVFLPGWIGWAQVLGAVALFAACGWEYPEIIVENQIGPTVMVRNVRYSGCVWPKVLAPGEKTTPRDCMPGDRRVFFEMTDASIPNEPWLGFQTQVKVDASSPSPITVVLRADAIERDLAAPNRFGH
ncbi:MAG: hypothetical protein GMKNLPBB_01269 [Myxococcota bacterium]|nr:hypothetical protein [Myxococcota bacterium]